MKKLLFNLRALMLLLLLMIVGVGNAWGEEVVYKTALFGSSYNSKGVSSYTGSFSATNDEFTVNLANFNNNNNLWSSVKTGNKTNAAVGTIITNAAIDKSITKVVVTIDAVTATSVNSIKLYSGTSSSSIATEEGSFTVASGAQTVTISSPAANKFYKIAFDCNKGSSNGLVTVSKVEYYKAADVVKSDPTFSIGNVEATVNDMLDIADALNITTNNTDQYSISYSSGNKSVADIEDGYLMAYAEGEATITATMGKTTNFNEAQTTFKVTVSSAGGPTKLSTPAGLSTVSITQNSASLSWGTVEGASSYTLKFGEEEITNATSPYNKTGLTAGTQYTWTVKAIGDGTNYSDGNYASTINFTTLSAPSITTQPTGATYSQTDAATALSFVVSGNPAPTYQWYSNTENTATVDEEHKISDATSSTYTPSTTNAGDTYYYCVATNSLGSVTSNVAKITVNKAIFTVTFDAGTGTCTTTSLTQVSKGASITLPASSTVTPATTEDGCKFIGWATSKTETATTTKPTLLSGTTYTPSNDETLYAVYQYAVGGNGGYYLSQTSSSTTYYMTASAGATTKIAEATEFFWGDGYLYSESNGEKTYLYHTSSGSTSIVSNTTKPTSYLWTITDNATTVKFRSQAQSTRYIGYGSSSFKAYASDQKLTKTPCGTVYYSSVPKAPVCSDVTLNTNGGTIKAGNVTTYREGVGATLPTDVTKTGYSFAGWYNNENLTGDAVTKIGTDATGAQEFWAKWTANTYTVKFNANGGTGTMADQSFTYDEAAKALTANAFTKTGYSFAGWAKTADGETAYEDKAEVRNLSATDNAIVNLYALWSVNNYYVVFNKNNENATGEMANQSITFGQSANLTANAYAATGQVFSGWATTTDGEVTYTDGASYTMNTEGATLYAKWIDDVKVSGVTLSETSKTVTYGAEDFTLTATIAPENAVDKTVTWTSSNPDVATVTNGTVHIVGAGSANITVKSNADETKTATCALTVNKADAVITPTTPNNTWDVTLKIGATLTPAFTTTPADAEVSLAITEGSDYISLSEGVITGVAAGEAKVTATFAGNDNYSQLVKTFNITVPEKLTLTYSVNGNTGIKAAGHYYEGDEVDLTAPTSGIPEGYVFMGWSSATVKTQQTAPTYVGTTMPAESKIYYAVFAVEGGSAPSATSITINSETSNFPSSYAAAADVNLNGISFNVKQAYVNVSKLQWRASTNSAGAGYIYNNDALNNIQSIVLSYTSDDTNKNFTVSVGSSANPTSGTSISGVVDSENSSVYTYDCSSANADYFVLTNGTGAGYLSSIVINYIKAGSTTYSDYTTSVIIKTLTGIEFGGSPKTVYTEEETFDPTGITVLASYEGEAEKEDITKDVTLTYSTNPLTVGTESINVSTSYKGFDINKDYTITVNAIPTYTITASAAEGGSYTVKISDAEAANVPAEGTTYQSRASKVITLTSVASEGYKLHSTPFVVKDADDTEVKVSKNGDNYTFTMPAKAVTITAQFVQQFTIATTTPENGTIASIKDGDGNDISATSKGSKVWVTVAPDTHYHLDAISVKKADESTVAVTVDPENANRASFTMPQSNVTVSATFAENAQYQVTWMANGKQLKQETVYTDDGSAAPEVTCPIGYTLAGWTKTVANTESTTAPTYVTLTDGKYMPEAATTLHAVYTRSEGEDVVYKFNKGVTGFPTAYNASGADLTVNEFTFELADIAYFSGIGEFMQFKKKAGAIYNTSALPTAVKSVEVTYNSSTLNKNIKLHLGDDAESLDTEVTATENEDVHTFNCSSYSNKFFKLIEGDGAASVDEVVLTCAPTGTTYYTTDVHVTPTLTFAPAEYWVSEGATIVSPVVTCNQEGATITYSSNNESLVVVDENSGDLLIDGSTGDVTITASVAESELYYSASASYVLHVVAPLSLTVSAARWATFAPSLAVELPAGVYAESPSVRVYHIATNTVDDGTIEFAKTQETITAGKTIAAGTGILVKAEAGTYNFPVNTTVASTALDGNQLVGVLKSTTRPGNNAYIFKNGTKGIGFYPWNSGSLSAGKAYLQLTETQGAGEVRFLGLPEDDDNATALEIVYAHDDEDNAFNLFGQKVDTRNYKGMVVKNGAKYIVK